MTAFHVAAALFGVYMLARHLPRVVRAIRSPEHRAGVAIPVMNVVLALAILVAAVKGLATVLISR